MLEQVEALTWRFLQHETGKVIVITLSTGFTGVMAVTDDDGGIYAAQPYTSMDGQT